MILLVATKWPVYAHHNGETAGCLHAGDVSFAHGLCSATRPVPGDIVDTDGFIGWFVRRWLPIDGAFLNLSEGRTCHGNILERMEYEAVPIVTP